MESNETGTEVLVISDGEGNIYVIPRATLERHKLSAEAKAMLEEPVGDDVSGFIHLGPGRQIVDPVAGLRAGFERLEAQAGARPGAGSSHADIVSMLPLTALTGFFTVVHDLNRYLNIEESKIRLV